MMELPALLQCLFAEHDVRYVYRGQTRDWAGALVPSLYRPFTRSSAAFPYSGSDRLYATGSAFVQEEPWEISWSRLQVEEAKLLTRRILTAHELRHAFGYALAQIFAQQAGLWSEGLDVTTSPEVAAFFATHDWKDGRYLLAEVGSGVIYRFTVRRPQMSINLLRGIDFYSCPTFLPSEDIIRLFAECDSLDEAVGWLVDYRSELMLGISKNATAARTNRPIQYLHFPRGSVSRSRIVRQRAGLLMPDMVLSEYWSRTDVPAPPDKIAQTAQPWIEDLSQRTGTTKYQFAHSSGNALSLNLASEGIFPMDDIVCNLLRGWLSRTIGSNTWLFDSYTLDACERRDDLLF